ncbi:MAG: PAS domain-containing protein [Sedimentibacter sp.]|jgi:PAS domain S-box-containing protein
MDIYKLIQIINNARDAIIAIDENAHITLINEAAEKLSGISKEEAIDKHIENVIPNTRLPKILKTGIKELNVKQKFRNTEIIANRIPLSNVEGKIIGAFAVFTDITQTKKMTNEIINLKEYTDLLRSWVLQ